MGPVEVFNHLLRIINWNDAAVWELSLLDKNTW